MRAAGVSPSALCERLRTNAAKRMRQREAALYLLFKVVKPLSGHWRALNGGQNLMALVREGYVFRDGIDAGARQLLRWQPRRPDHTGWKSICCTI